VSPSSNPLALIQYALEARIPIQIVNFPGTVRRVRVRHDKALLLVACPPGVGLDLKRPPDEQDTYLLVHVPRAAREQMDSPIVQAPSLIIRPN